MKIGIFTDPHLGKVLSANTTLDSRKRLQNDLYYHVKGILQQEGAGTWLCLGDLLDKYQNTEATLLQALDVAQSVDMVMAGNHDVVNDVTRVGTLQVLEQVLSSEGDSGIRRVPFNESGFFVTEMGQCAFYIVPHHSRDDLFEEALCAATKMAEDRELVDESEGRTRRHMHLLLHCNYDMEFACNDVTLNLSRQRAGKLLEVFDRILIGHDHNPKEDFDGRLIVLGNTHPTGFGDISDKRIALVDADTGEIEFVTVWRKGSGYAELQVGELLTGDLDVIGNGLNFIDIKGTVEADQAMDLSRVLKRLWSVASPPYAIRANVHLAKAGQEVVDDEHPAEDAWETIRAELQAAGRDDLLELLDGLKVATAERVVEE